MNVQFFSPYLLTAVSLALAGCAGYQFGAATMFPQNIRTVHVPVFESDSFRRGLGEWLTEAVVKEIESRPGYKVVTRAHADSILEGRIIGDTKRVVVENRFDDPRDIEVTMRVHIRWLDNRGQLLTPATTIPVPDTLIEAQHAISLVPEVGQSNVSNQQENIEQLAKQIVATMEMPW
jgi:hypothetical protein